MITAALLGVGLAMDAFSVSLANGLADREMNKGRMFEIAGTFAGFQFAMPMIGWVFVHFAAEKLDWFAGLVPWIALGLLLYIGGKMLKEGIEENRSLRDGAAGSDVAEDAGDGEGAKVDAKNDPKADPKGLARGDLIMQGIATSIDALSVGFTIASYALLQAFASSVIIGVVTLVICLAGLALGKKMGMLLAGKASILGGLILIGIGIEIFVKGVIL